MWYPCSRVKKGVSHLRFPTTAAEMKIVSVGNRSLKELLGSNGPGIAG